MLQHVTEGQKVYRIYNKQNYRTLATIKSVNEREKRATIELEAPACGFDWSVPFEILYPFESLCEYCNGREEATTQIVITNYNDETKLLEHTTHHCCATHQYYPSVQKSLAELNAPGDKESAHYERFVEEQRRKIHQQGYHLYFDGECYTATLLEYA